MALKAQISSETKAVIDWMKSHFECYAYDDETGYDEDFVQEMARLWKRSKGDLSSFAQEKVKQELSAEGYSRFEQFGFLNTFLKEGFARTDWLFIGSWMVKELKL